MFNSFSSRVPNKNHFAAAKRKLRDLVGSQLKSLAVKRKAGITIDAYGNLSSAGWAAEVQYFVDRVLLPGLTAEEAKAVLSAGVSAVAQELIEEPVRAECLRMHASGEYDMTLERRHPPHLVGAPERASENRDGKKTYWSNNGLVNRGLIIREEPLERILSGRKLWEMRSSHTRIRGPVALIRKGSKAIFGVAEIVDSRGPLTEAEMLETVRFHGIEPSRLRDSEITQYKYAWVLGKVRRLDRAISYHHRGGVVFVSLDHAVALEIERSLRALPRV